MKTTVAGSYLVKNSFIITSFNLVTNLSDDLLELTEYLKDDLLGKDISYILKNLLHLSQDKIEQIYSKGKLNCFLFTKFLEAREVSILFIKNDSDQCTYFIKENPISRLEEKFSYVEHLCIAEKSGIAIYLAEDLTLLKANDTYIEYLNDPYNKREVCIGKKVDEIVKGYKGSVCEEIWDNLIKTGEPFYANEVMYDRYDKGVTYWDSSIVPIFENGKVKYFIENALEVTDRVLNRKLVGEQNEKLNQQRELLEMILDNSYENISVQDAYGNYIFNKNNIIKEVSTKFADVNEVFKAVKYFDIDGNEIPLERLVAYRVKNGETIKDEIVGIRVAGEEYYLLYSGKPIYDKDGKYLYGIGCSRNITEIINGQKALKETQKLLLKSEREKNEALENAMKMKDEFLATITHEFKTPITIINAALQTIESIYRNQLSDHLWKHLHRIRMNSFRQLRLVNNLLDIARYNAGHLATNEINLDIVYITKAIVDSVYLYAKQKSIDLKFSSDCECMEMALDDEKYERILLNLLSNAIKFTPKGKTIYIHIASKNRDVEVSIRDEGIGIPKSKQKIIFERFGQVDSSLSRNTEGTGIGLSLVKMLVTGMKGTIKVDSEVDIGSTFTITLPLKKLKQKKSEMHNVDRNDDRVIHSALIEFSDIYMY